MVSFWWASVAQATAAAFLGVVVFPCLFEWIPGWGIQTRKFWVKDCWWDIFQ